MGKKLSCKKPHSQCKNNGHCFLFMLPISFTQVLVEEAALCWALEFFPLCARFYGRRFVSTCKRRNFDNEEVLTCEIQLIIEWKCIHIFWRNKHEIRILCFLYSSSVKPFHDYLISTEEKFLMRNCFCLIKFLQVIEKVNWKITTFSWAPISRSRTWFKEVFFSFSGLYAKFWWKS